MNKYKSSEKKNKKKFFLFFYLKKHGLNLDRIEDKTQAILTHTLLEENLAVITRLGIPCSLALIHTKDIQVTTLELIQIAQLLHDGLLGMNRHSTKAAALGPRTDKICRLSKNLSSLDDNSTMKACIMLLLLESSSIITECI